MKQFLLTGLFATAITLANATDYRTETLSTQLAKQDMTTVSAPVSHKAQLAKRPIMRSLPDIRTNRLAPITLAKAKAMADEASENTFFESFEEWPIDEFDFEWLPEGWTAQRQADVDDLESWFPIYQYNYAYPTPADGQYYFCIMYSEEVEQDEWLITPEIEIAEGDDLSYYLYYQPIYLFSDENLDWDTMEFDGERVVSATFQVMIKAEGDTEWTKLQDIADKYMDYTVQELIDAQPTGMQKQTVKLSDYVGKKVQLGFRYVGILGDAMWLDAIRVGISSLENISYSLPAGAFYWGYDTGFTGLGTDVAQVPVYSPVTFTNTSLDEATFEWTYLDPATREVATDDNQIELTLTYEPTYTEEGTQKFEVFKAPLLTASAAGKAPAEYQSSVFIHAGGTANYAEDGKEYNFSLFPFEKGAVKIGGYTVNDAQIGDMAIPIFGHNQSTNRYWYNYTAGGDQDASPETCYNHLIGIANLYMPEQGNKLVVTGANVYGFGLINSSAQLKFSIYALLQTEDGISTDPSDMTVVASKTITGADILASEGDNNVKDYICMPFVFDQTAVVEATEEHPAFFFMLEGFNSDDVEYFMPLQTIQNSSDYINHAYMMSEIDFEVASGRPSYISVKPLLYYEDAQYIRPASSFAFGIMAEYPWLTCNTEEVTLGAEDESTEVALESYYDGSKLTVEAPKGLTATVVGRYNNCKLTISRDENTTDEVTGTVTVAGPGVEVAIDVKADEKSGIDAIINADATVAETYDLFGRRVAKTSNGLYIVKYNDGTVSKKVVIE